MRKLSCLLLLAACGLTACGRAARTAPAAIPDPLTADMDTAVKPGVNFFLYANEGWIDKNPIPATDSSWGIGNLVENEINARLRAISQQAAASHAAAGSDEQKIGDFWAVGMDAGHADAAGLTPLEPYLKQIAAVTTPAQALAVAHALAPLGVNVFYRMGVEQDEKDSARMTVHLSQGGLGLPNRDFYFNPEPGVAKLRGEYVAHLQAMLQLLGQPPARAAAGAAAVMKFETALAKASRPLAALRDPNKNYNPMTPEALTARYSPRIAWRQALDGWNLATKTVVVGQPEFFAGLNAALGATPARALRDYLRLHLVTAYAPYLSTAIRDENFRFYSTEMSGQKEQQPRWKQVLRAENRALGMELGRKFVAAYFPPAEKARYTALVQAIRTSFRHRIERLTWMSPATKAQALVKLNAVVAKVGYPDQWPDDSGLTIQRDSFAGNMMRANEWRFHKMVARFGKPVNRNRWDMTPQTYNAYYNPSNNEIVLPAAQFAVPGVPDQDLDDAIVYGYSGASTIGHEITHGFDDEGRHFDAQGNLKDWWTKQDSERFDQRAALMVKEFDAYQPIAGLHIRGAACLGENIADYGGILIGLDAFEQTAEYKSGKKIDGLTPLQRFFLGYALGWLSHQTEASLRRQLLSDVHAPAEYRVIGPLSNIPAFYQAFGVKPGQPMWRPAKDRVHIW
jgi:putative endopeptidase